MIYILFDQNIYKIVKTTFFYNKNSYFLFQYHRLLSWWEEWTYCNGLMALDNNVWKDVYNIYIKESDNKYLKFLACSENIVIIKDYSSLMLEGNEPIKDKDRIIGFHYIIAKHAKSNKILDYILANFEKITSRYLYILFHKCILLKIS